MVIMFPVDEDENLLIDVRQRTQIAHGHFMCLMRLKQDKQTLYSGTYQQKKNYVHTCPVAWQVYLARTTLEVMS